VGWNILLEYLCAASYIAVGWSGYAVGFAHKIGLSLPAALISPPIALSDGRLSYQGGFINLPSVLVSVAVMLVARRGIVLSARVNVVLVSLKLGVLLLFLVAAVRYVSVANWTPFVPPNSGTFGSYGWSGVLRGAAVVFVAFLGFDALSTLAQETRNPQRDMPVGIIGSLAICTVLYISVALVLTGITPYWTLNVPSPLSTALQAVGGALDWLAPLVEIVAMSGLASVLLIVLGAQARICLAMGQDGLLPGHFARIHPRHRTPSFATAVGGLLVAALSSLFPVSALSQLVSLGTLTVFIVVCGGVLVLRRTRPDIPRAFRVPGSWPLPAAGIAICLYLLIGVPKQAWVLFSVWSLGGLFIYGLFGRQRAARSRG
jgi:APA family basic amino acid/polyamine antiporter